MSQTLGSYIAFDVAEAVKNSAGSGYGRDTYLVIFKAMLCHLIFIFSNHNLQGICVKHILIVE